jgi:UDP-N-acetylglucosamine--N-acetylmuramyl-(pentapeptide) pyrophosphoryl-undecaprenol N-acetylglucosamine transferase
MKPETQRDLTSAYRAASIPAVVEPFLHEMRLAWGAADAAISRAGASSVAEIAVNAVPTLFLPYPHHRDQHQRWNAEPLREFGGAMIADDLVDPSRTADSALRSLERLLQDDAARDAMRQSLIHNRPEDAAGLIAGKLRRRITARTSPLADAAAG